MTAIDTSEIEAAHPAVPERLRHRELWEQWEDEPGIAGFLSTVDHKRIGIRYFVTALVFLLLGGIEALLLRTQLATADGSLLGPQAYNELMTMHGTTMILLFNTPMFSAFGNYLLPLQLGTRDMAFPRLNALSYWIFLLSGLFIYTSFLVGDIPDGGWFAYVPLTGDEYSPGAGMDFWAIGVTFLGISTTVGAINFIVTTFRLRAPGMSFNRMPLFAWAILAMSFMIVFALPAITLSGLLLELDRAFGMHWFDAAAGGDPLLYQHLFWIWGHPEVYIVFIPATGIASMVIAAFTRRTIAAYPLVVAALVSTSFISFGLWVHHMFATGLPFLVASFFSAASMLVAIPSGVQMFAWLTTISHANGRPRWEPPMLWAVGFLVLFLIGGLTGVMVGVVPWDVQVTDSYFVVAHFHYVLIGGSVFPIFAGLHFWLPKITGRLYHRGTAVAAFWLTFVGMNLTFFVQHLLGLRGMPRRVYTYGPGLGWQDMNRLSTVGAFVLAAGFLLALGNLARSLRWGPPTGNDPWGADTLEWATTSPPPPYNFAAIPMVSTLHPRWDDPYTTSGARDPAAVDRIGDEALTEPAHGHHRTPVSSVLDADRVEVITSASPSPLPLLVALAGLLGSIALLVESWLIGGAATLLVVVALIRWHVQDEELRA
ncbi:MAG: cytochrome c oxidase subunit I [Acidimicrobiia bacterium]